MPRSRAVLQSEFPYNISARCINREWFNLPMEHVWEIFCEELTRSAQDHNLKIHSFILMSNHFHLIASTPDANLSTCMMHFMRKTSRRLTKDGNRINQTYAGRHFKCILQSFNYYLNAYKYNYRNPVTAGICERVEEYKFSTFRGLLNSSELKVPLLEDSTFIADPVGTKNWLNVAPEPKMLEAVRLGLKGQYFKNGQRTNRGFLEELDVL